MTHFSAPATDQVMPFMVLTGCVVRDYPTAHLLAKAIAEQLAGFPHQLAPITAAHPRANGPAVNVYALIEGRREWQCAVAGRGVTLATLQSFLEQKAAA